MYQMQIVRRKLVLFLIKIKLIYVVSQCAILVAFLRVVAGNFGKCYRICHSTRSRLEFCALWQRMKEGTAAGPYHIFFLLTVATNSLR